MLPGIQDTQYGSPAPSDGTSGTRAYPAGRAAAEGVPAMGSYFEMK